MECACGNLIAEGRIALGYDTCLECGEQAAQAEADRRKTQVAPLYNKGAVQYITSLEQVKDLGRK